MAKLKNTRTLKALSLIFATALIISSNIPDRATRSTTTPAAAKQRRLTTILKMSILPFIIPPHIVKDF